MTVIEFITSHLPLTYVVTVSVFSAFFCIIDKINAKKRKRRVSEKNLLILSAIGGSLAMFITMLLIRHKVTKVKFMLGIPAIITIQLLIAYAMFDTLPFIG